MVSAVATANSRIPATRLKHDRLVAVALATVSFVCVLTFGAFIVVLDKPFFSPQAPIILSLPQVQSLNLQHFLQPAPPPPFGDYQPVAENSYESRAIVMSCPVAHTKTHDGPWKPRNLARGAEAVVRQLVALNVTIPFFFVYYEHEQSAALPFCHSLAADVADALVINCFLVPEPYPKGQYGYAKIFAIKHVPARHVLWFDCDAFPIRDPSPLFADPEYRKKGAMFWPDSRDFFDEVALLPLLTVDNLQEMFPMHAWWVRQGFDTALVLIDRVKSAIPLQTLCQVAKDSKYDAIRSLSMGDKDLFHVVWIMLGRNFSFVPFVGETGTVQRKSRTVIRSQGSRVFRDTRSRFGWHMSSQVKYGRDGSAYALHQLHRQADVSRAPGRSRYVPPLIEVRLDLRTVINPANSLHLRMQGEFVDRVERVLIHPSGRTLSDPTQRSRALGLELDSAVGRFGRAVKVMDQAWRKRIEPDKAAQDIVSNYLSKRGDRFLNGETVHKT